MAYDAAINTYAQQFNVDPALIRAVIGVESGGNPGAVSGKGAQGLAQLMPDTAKKLGVDPKDPVQNIKGAAKLLDQLLTQTGGNVPQALAMYHGGQNTANWGPLTAAYPGKVLSRVDTMTLPGIPETKSAPTAPVADAFAAYSKGGSPDAPQPAASSAAPDPFTAYTKQSPTAPQPAASSAAAQPPQQDNGFGPSNTVNDFINAAGHHAGNAVLGAVQLGANALGMGQPVNSFIQQREANYQAQVPNSTAAYAGAATGEVLPFLGAGGVGLVRGAMDQGASLAARLGAGATGQRIATRVGGLAGNTGLGMLSGAIAPVTDGGQDYGAQKEQQIGTGGVVGAAAGPLLGALSGAGKYVGNLAGSLVRPFTESGQNTIATNVLRQAAADGPTAINASRLVPGSTPTLAESTGNSGIATLQRVVADRNPNAFAAQQQANAVARLDALQKTVGTPADVESAQAARDVAANADLSKVFTGAQAADPKPVVDVIDGILNGPSGKRDAVKSVLTNLRSKIVNGPDKVTSTPASTILGPDGTPITPASSSSTPNLETDPETLYNSVRKQIGDMLDTRMAVADPKGLQASRELLKVRDTLDDVIAQAAPGFNDYLTNYARASQPINAMQYLQGLSLTDAKGNLTLQKVQTAINGIAKKQAAPGTNDAKAITDDQLTALKSIRDDLLRQRVNLTDAGRSAGSNTYQNFATDQLLRAAVPGKIGQILSNAGGTSGATAGATAGAILAGPPGAAIGGVLGSGLSKFGGGLLKNQNQAIENRLMQMLLNPEEAQKALGPSGLAKPAISPARYNLLPTAGATTGVAGLLNNQRQQR